MQFLQVFFRVIYMNGLKAFQRKCFDYTLTTEKVILKDFELVTDTMLLTALDKKSPRYSWRRHGLEYTY